LNSLNRILSALFREINAAVVIDAIILAVNVKLIQMRIAPTESDLQRVVQISMELSLRTKIRRQIIGLMWRILT